MKRLVLLFPPCFPWHPKSMSPTYSGHGAAHCDCHATRRTIFTLYRLVSHVHVHCYFKHDAKLFFDCPICRKLVILHEFWLLFCRHHESLFIARARQFQTVGSQWRLMFSVLVMDELGCMDARRHVFTYHAGIIFMLYLGLTISC